MASRFFVRRSAVRTPNTDFDAAMQHEEIGPFDSAEEAREIWTERMARALLGTYGPGIESWKADFRGQYLGLLTAAEETPEWDKLEADGIRWTLRKIG